MTWNPIVHMGLTSLIIFALIGIAWGAMPVDTSRFKGRYDDLRVSAAGPAMNAGIAGVLMVVTPFWVVFAEPHVGVDAFENVTTFLVLGAMLNVALLILNLLPIPPLDGSRMLANVSRGYRSFAEGPNAMIVGLFMLFGVIVFGIDLIFQAATIVVGTVQGVIIVLLS
jgi:Zn-dependent protease